MSNPLSSLMRSATGPLACVELFAFGNLAFLALDVYIAHSTNSFALSAEWIPVIFSVIAPGLLLVAFGVQRGLCPPTASSATTVPLWLARAMGLTVGALALVVGIAGLIWHLESQFFSNLTLASLVYTAPFVAPLAYSGVGFLLLLNRTMSSETDEWATWVILLALGGFIGNFVLSLADHAQNGFFEWREWIPVVAAAVAVGNLAAIVVVGKSRNDLKLSATIMLLQCVIGVLGWYFHARAILASRMDSLWDKIVYSAPVFAPLLFASLGLLGMIGLWAMSRDVSERKLAGQ